VARLGKVKARRDATAVQRALETLRGAARVYGRDDSTTHDPLLPLVVDAVRARGSVGEISDALRDEWGAYRPG
jgi:methylmalonyl-CoA mutase N-terminal domain/subunit